jgi:LysR family glycine cleavage system transcriptional activator
MPGKFNSTSLPPLEWLRVFEAAGRLGSFTAAANELNLTQAAASQRIRKLEARLGTRLFVRLARGVELSADGEAYLPHVQNSLEMLLRSTIDLFGTARQNITLAAPSSVAQLWIAPRLTELSERLPHLQISIATIHRLSDYSITENDLEVHFGSGDWPDQNAVRLFDENLAPVVAPRLLSTGLSDWRELPVLSLSGPRDGWREWATTTGVAPPRPATIRFDSFTNALHAAISGAGVLLASLALVQPMLEAKQLVRLPEKSLRMSEGYWLTWPASQPFYSEREVMISLLIDKQNSETV